MICKYCNAELEQDTQVCPVCGKELTEEPTPATEVLEETQAPAQETPVEETAEETVVEEIAEEPAAEEIEEESQADGWEMPPVKKKKASPWVIVLAISSAVIALGVLAMVLLTALGVKIDLKPRPNDITKKDSYVVSQEQMQKKAEVVVATIADKKLTNTQLQIYYRMQLQDFLSYYGNYLSTLGLDLTKPLAEQTCYFDDTLSWEQYILNIAIQTWQNNQTMALLAEEDGFTLDEATAAELAKLPEMLEEQAAEGKYESADAMIKEVLGDSCDMEGYIEYVTLITLRNAYYATRYEALVPNEEDTKKYYIDHEDEFTDNGITQESGLASAVRHILVCPVAEQTADGASVIKDEAWEECLKKAEKILQEWKDGEATEESFAKLATTYTEDGGSKETGGLYTDVAPGSNYVESFLNWSIDMSRKPGDTGIVKTEYGYHIMYFVEGEPYWMNMARTNLLSERITDMIDAAELKWPMKVNYSKIALAELDLV